MRRTISFIFMWILALAVLIGCGKTDTNDADNAAESAQSESETADGISDNTEAMHCILLKGQGDTWLFADTAASSVFTAPIPEDLTDAAGNAMTADQLVSGNRIDIYGNGIMLESYPGQYPGVTKMVMTGEGSPEDVEPYQDEINMIFAEPDLSNPPQLNIVYTASFGTVTSIINGPGNYEWTVPAEGDEANTIAACGRPVLQWDNLESVTIEGRTDMRLEGEPLPDKATVCRWPVSAYLAESEDLDNVEGEAVTVETGADGQIILKDVEAGYVYEIVAEWEMGQAEYGFITKAK